MSSPSLDQDLGLREIIEEFDVQQLVMGLAIEALVVAVFPWTTWFNEEGLGANIKRDTEIELLISANRSTLEIKPSERGNA